MSINTRRAMDPLDAVEDEIGQHLEGPMRQEAEKPTKPSKKTRSGKDESYRAPG